MRRPMAFLAALALAGCIAPAAPEASLPAADAADVPLLRILTEDLEVRPLAGVVVALGNRTAVSDEGGYAVFSGVGPGQHQVTAWAPGRYHNRTTLDVTDLNLTYELLLAERPEYIGFVKVASIRGSCNVVKPGPLAAERTCQPTPPSSETQNRGVQPVVANVSRLEVWMTWNGDPAAFRLGLTFSRNEEPLALSDGTTSMAVEGGSPLVVDLGLDAFGPDARAAPFDLGLEVQPTDDDGLELTSREFVVETTMWYHEPPPDDPCVLHKSVC